MCHPPWLSVKVMNSETTDDSRREPNHRLDRVSKQLERDEEAEEGVQMFSLKGPR